MLRRGTDIDFEVTDQYGEIVKAWDYFRQQWVFMPTPEVVKTIVDTASAAFHPSVRTPVSQDEERRESQLRRDRDTLVMAMAMKHWDMQTEAHKHLPRFAMHQLQPGGMCEGRAFGYVNAVVYPSFIRFVTQYGVELEVPNNLTPTQNKWILGVRTGFVPADYVLGVPDVLYQTWLNRSSGGKS